MQDKEFDRLFNSKLGDLEMEPSPMVWDNIAGELHGKKGKRGFLPYLSIAASVLILASAGWLFFKPTEKVNLKPYKDDKVAMKQDNATPEVTPDITAPSKVEEVTNEPVQQVATISKATQQTPKAVINEPVEQAVAPEFKAPAPVEPVLAAVTPQVQNQGMTVPDKATPLAIKTMPDQQQIIETVAVTTTYEAVKTPERKHGIRSLGGLINAIVAKVDKRQDKLIEFTEDEDEGSNITGVNLGLVKIKKQ